MVNRRLIRPSLSEMRDQGPAKYVNGQKKRMPPEQTHAEQYYYLKQMTGRTPMVIQLTDGETINGVIEWYDRDCIKVNRDNGPNLVIPKHVIKYMHKENESDEDSPGLQQPFEP